MGSDLSATSISRITAKDQIEIADALNRFCAGQYLRHGGLFASAFTTVASVEFRGPTRRLGAEIQGFEGCRAITDTIFAGSIGSTRRSLQRT